MQDFAKIFDIAGVGQVLVSIEYPEGPVDENAPPDLPYLRFRLPRVDGQERQVYVFETEARLFDLLAALTHTDVERHTRRLARAST